MQESALLVDSQWGKVADARPQRAEVTPHVLAPVYVSISEGGCAEAAVPFLLPWGEPLVHLYIGPGRFKGRSYPCLQFSGSSSKSFLLHKPVFLYKALHWYIQTLVSLIFFTPKSIEETINWEAVMF